jgi:hypothetical protein
MLTAPAAFVEDLMDHHRFHWLEKVQVQLATLLSLALVYYVSWSYMEPRDPGGPVSFAATGSYGQMILFALTVWALAAVGAVLTVSARPEGAMLAAFIGAGGVSLHSTSIRPLLWNWAGRLSGLYWVLIVEMILLGLLVSLTVVVVVLLRRLIERFKPSWAWRPPLVAGLPPAAAGQHRGRPQQLARCAYCLLLGVFGSAVLLLLLMQSGERGQTLFAVLISFVLSSLVAHQVFPSCSSAVAWATPVVTGVMFYALASASLSGVPPDAWAKTPFYAYALPVDWMTAGGGGALLGFWTSQRIHEFRHFEKEADRKGT